MAMQLEDTQKKDRKVMIKTVATPLGLCYDYLTHNRNGGFSFDSFNEIAFRYFNCELNTVGGSVFVQGDGMDLSVFKKTNV